MQSIFNLFKGLLFSCLLLQASFAQATLTAVNDGTVVDPATGLIWMRCAMGQIWTGSTCTGTASSHTFDQANALTGTVMFAGQNDWRLPTIHELQPIADRSAVGPAIDRVAFPSTPGSNFWSSSPYVGSANYAWFVSFHDGASGYNYRSSVYAVRLVRDGQTASTTTIAAATYDAKGTSAGATAAVASTTVTDNTCSPSLGTHSASVRATASTGSVSVTSACAWTAASNANWLTISSGASGSGSGIVSYAVAANTGTTARTGTLSIAGQTFTVAQKGFTPAAPVAMAQGINASGTGKAASATSYTVPGTLGNDVFVLTAGNRYYGGAGNDTYIVSPTTLLGDVSAQIIDIEGDNLIQLVDGMTVMASTFYSDAAQLTLSSGAKVQILGASKFKFQIGANALAGDTAGALTYSEFVTSLGATLPTGTVPTSGIAGYLVPTGFTQAAAPVPSVGGNASTVPGTLGDDVLVPSGGNTYFGGGGSDIYIISPYTLSGAVTAKIIDKEGTNVIQLVNGLTIASSSFLNDAVQITLSNGATVQILGASGFSYQLGANAPAAEVASSLNYAQFATTLGTSVPAAGAAAVSGSANYVVQKIDTSPKVNIQISSPKVHVGEQATITWDTTNVTNCVGSDGWSGSKANNGSELIQPTAGGQFKYSISCTPVYGGSSVSASTSLIVPMPVLKSSYENKIAAGKVIGQIKLPTFSLAYAFADFRQDGTYSVVIATQEYDLNKPSSEAKPGKFYFYQMINGQMIDITSILLSDNTGCIHPRKVMVADLNNDKKPDVVFACHGYDAAPFPGEQQRALLSQPNGTYQNIILPFNGFAHGGSVADVNNDGFADIIYTGMYAESRPSYVINNKNGSFTMDDNKLSNDMKKCCLPIYSLEFIDFNKDGKFDVWFAGVVEQDSFWPSTIYFNDGSNNFKSDKIVIPSMTKSGVALDIVYENNIIYILYSINFYNGSQVEKYEYTTSSIIYTHAGYYIGGMSWVPWMHIFNNNIVSTEKLYGLNIKM